MFIIFLSFYILKFLYFYNFKFLYLLYFYIYYIHFYCIYPICSLHLLKSLIIGSDLCVHTLFQFDVPYLTYIHKSKTHNTLKQKGRPINKHYRKICFRAVTVVVRFLGLLALLTSSISLASSSRVRLTGSRGTRFQLII